MATLALHKEGQPVTYRTEVLFLFVYRFLMKPNGFVLSLPARLFACFSRIPNQNRQPRIAMPVGSDAAFLLFK